MTPSVVFPCMMFYVVVNRGFSIWLPAIINVWADMIVTRQRVQVNNLFSFLKWQRSDLIIVKFYL